jgi:hypothetical protein
MFDDFDPRWTDDPRDDDKISRDCDDDSREWELVRDVLGELRDDPRDVLVEGLDLPRRLEPELVQDRDHVYEINGEESRILARSVRSGSCRSETFATLGWPRPTPATSTLTSCETKD